MLQKYPKSIQLLKCTKTDVCLLVLHLKPGICVNF